MVRLRSNFSTTTPVRTTGIRRRRSISESASKTSPASTGSRGARSPDPKDGKIKPKVRQMSLTSSDEPDGGESTKNIPFQVKLVKCPKGKVQSDKFICVKGL